MTERAETRDGLEARKRDLFSAIQLLEQDRRDGAVDEGAYQAARRRYEVEAASVLERLDALPTEGEVPPTRRAPRWIGGVAAGVAGVAIVVLLIAAIQQRSGNQAITGSVPTIQPTTSVLLAEAQKLVASHPGSVQARIRLGNVYLDQGQPTLADQQYVQAMRLAPKRPEARTLHAMVLGSEGQTAGASRVLRVVERTHPTYARAWLLDGIMAARTPHGRARALASWRRFLALQPHTAVSATVRHWIKQEQKKASR